jgi:4-amino-4-deoxy-L-arabinose transferase-like glycosyltransferase
VKSNSKYRLVFPEGGLWVVICYLIFVLALALRLYQLGADSLWEDEIFTATQSPLAVAKLLEWTAGDIHPPGYYLIVGRLADWLGWPDGAPSSLTDWLWRFPSVLAGTLAVAVTYRLGADWLGQWTGLAGALLLAVNPVAIQYSQEARMHELFLLGTALSTWTLARALARPRQWRWWLGYGLATTLSLYTVYLAFVVLAAQAGWVMTSRPQPLRAAWPTAATPGRLADRRPALTPGYRSFVSSHRLSSWLASVVLAFVLYLPWWPTLLGIVTRRLALQGGGVAVSEVESGVGSPAAFLVKGIYSLGPAGGWPAWLFLGLWAIGLVSVLMRRKPALAFLGGLWVALPLALPFVFRDPRATHMRYVFLLPVYLVFVAQGGLALGVGGWQLGARGCPRGGLRSGLIWRSVVVLGLALISILYLPGYYQRTKPDWRGVGAYLEERTIPGDVVVTGPLFDVGRYLDYYYDGPAELMPPASLVASLPGRLASMRSSGGRVWAVTRFRPAPIAAVRSVQFPGVIVSEPVVAVYEPKLLTMAMIDLMKQAVAAAPGWAAEMSAGGVMEPDPSVAQAAAYLFLGDVYLAAGRLPEAVAAYEAMVADEPAAAGGYVVLARAYEAVGRWEAAVGAYRQAVARNPAWQGAQAEMAATLADAGRWAEAAAVYGAIVD